MTTPEGCAVNRRSPWAPRRVGAGEEPRPVALADAAAALQWAGLRPPATP